MHQATKKKKTKPKTKKEKNKTKQKNKKQKKKQKNPTKPNKTKNKTKLFYRQTDLPIRVGLSGIFVLLISGSKSDPKTQKLKKKI